MAVGEFIRRTGDVCVFKCDRVGETDSNRRQYGYRQSPPKFKDLVNRGGEGAISEVCVSQMLCLLGNRIQIGPGEWVRGRLIS